MSCWSICYSPRCGPVVSPPGSMSPPVIFVRPATKRRYSIGLTDSSGSMLIRRIGVATRVTELLFDLLSVTHCFTVKGRDTHGMMNATPGHTAAEHTPWETASRSRCFAKDRTERSMRINLLIGVDELARSAMKQSSIVDTCFFFFRGSGQCEIFEKSIFFFPCFSF